MGWLMTIPQALIALVIVLPIGLLGAWLRRVVTRVYRHDLTGWMALACGVLFETRRSNGQLATRQPSEDHHGDHLRLVVKLGGIL